MYNICFNLLSDTGEMHGSKIGDRKSEAGLRRSAFDLLDKRIRDILTEKEILAPTDPQQRAMPEILAGKNTLLIAPTGMGKTEAAVLPVFHKFLNEPHESKGKGISIVYITPLRALNRDMMERMLHWGEKLGIDVAVRHGDTPAGARRRMAVHPPDILLTTPESLEVLLVGRAVDKAVFFANLTCCIIDEVHAFAGDDREAPLDS